MKKGSKGMDFFDEYFKYVGDSESPNCYHRWCALSTLSTIIGREIFLPFGHGKVYPNQYILLLGCPGARKNTALNISRSILTKAGYKRFAKDRTSPERFFVDMIPKIDEDADLEILVMDAPSEICIMNGEFLDFIGRGNMDFLTALTNLWDNKNEYEHPKLHGKSVFIQKPTINILGGATVKGLGLAIPPEALGTGILSRLILVHSEPTNKKITWPVPIPDSASDNIVEVVMKIRTDLKGTIERTKEVEKLGMEIYTTFPGIEDGRFADYCSRRYDHLLKLSLLICISRGATLMNMEDMLKANTILHMAEKKMPKALGEFGKSKYSDVANTIMDALGRTHKPLSHSELWKMVAKDLSDIKDLGMIMKNLLTSDKAQVITAAGKQGYLPLYREHKEWDKELILEGFLTKEEEI